METTTTEEHRAPLLRRHTEIIGGLLAAVLFAAAYMFSTPPFQTALFGIGPHPEGEPDVGPAIIPAVLATMVVVGVALTSVSTIARILSWVAMVPLWIYSLYLWYMMFVFGSDLAWTEPVTEVLFVVAVFTPPAAFLLVCWKLERPRVATYFGEAVLLIVIVSVLSLYSQNFRSLESDGNVGVDTALIFFGAAVLFAVAAWLVPTRRILYGAFALDGAVMAVCGLLGITTISEPGDPMNQIMSPVFAAVAIGIPVVGAIVQIAWWVRGRVNAVTVAGPEAA